MARRVFFAEENGFISTGATLLALFFFGFAYLFWPTIDDIDELVAALHQRLINNGNPNAQAFCFDVMGAEPAVANDCQTLVATEYRRDQLSFPCRMLPMSQECLDDVNSIIDAGGANCPDLFIGRRNLLNGSCRLVGRLSTTGFRRFGDQ